MLYFVFVFQYTCKTLPYFRILGNFDFWFATQMGHWAKGPWGQSNCYMSLIHFEFTYKSMLRVFPWIVLSDWLWRDVFSIEWNPVRQCSKLVSPPTPGCKKSSSPIVLHSILYTIKTRSLSRIVGNIGFLRSDFMIKLLLQLQAKFCWYDGQICAVKSWSDNYESARSLDLFINVCAHLEVLQTQYYCVWKLKKAGNSIVHL